MYVTVRIIAMRFESKRDLWIVLYTRVAPFVLLAVISAFEYARGHNMRGPLAGLIVIVIAEVFLIGPILRSIYYVIDGDTLLISGGIARWRVPIRSIRSITPTRSILSSPALSLDRLRIEYDGKRIMVSPEEKQRFIAALKAVNPSIAV
jgi:PH (Pleckstrin Homology) domain-containing protein